MKIRLVAVLAAALVMSGGSLGAAEEGDPLFQVYGKYEKVVPPQPTGSPDQVEVVELFWYGCPHCFQLEPYMEHWLKNKPDYVVFRRMPAVFRSSWAPLAQAYYTAEALGVVDEVHVPLFESIHRARRPLNDKEQIMAFFAEHGVDKDEFSKAWDSFTVRARVRRATIMSSRYGAGGVPTIIVNGKYRTSGSLTGNFNSLIKVVDTLVEEEHKAMSAAMSTEDGAS